MSNWTPRKDERLRKMWKADCNGSVMADALGCSYKTVFMRAWKLGLPGRKTKPTAATDEGE